MSINLTTNALIGGNADDAPLSGSIENGDDGRLNADEQSIQSSSIDGSKDSSENDDEGNNRDQDDETERDDENDNGHDKVDGSAGGGRGDGGGNEGGGGNGGENGCGGGNGGVADGIGIVAGETNNSMEIMTRYWNNFPLGLRISFDNTELGDATYMQFRELPFVCVMAELVRPTRMTKPQSQPGLHHFTFMFGLTPVQALALSSEQAEVVFRFGEYKRHQPQMDNLPEPISICVNDQSLPRGVIQGPINITTQVKLARDKITSVVSLHWVPDFVVQSCFSIELIRRLTVPEMLKRIQMQVRPKHITQELIDSILSYNPTENHRFQSINVLLICPLSLQRMQYPCRPSTCKHLDCFDALEYLNRVFHTNDWHCPVCHERIMWEHMEIDEYFIELINTWFLMDVVHFETPIPGDLTPQSDSQSDEEDHIEYILPY